MVVGDVRSTVARSDDIVFKNPFSSIVIECGVVDRMRQGPKFRGISFEYEPAASF